MAFSEIAGCSHDRSSHWRWRYNNYVYRRYQQNQEDGKMKKLIMFTALGGLLILMISSYMQMPPMGNIENPSYNQVAEYYLKEAVEDTHSPNVVADIIMDYRSLDTLGEATVLFTSIAAVLTVLVGKDPKPEEEDVHHG